MDENDIAMDMGDEHSLEAEWHPPPTPQVLDQFQYHIALQEFGDKLQRAANSAFPNERRMRYASVYVLLLCWEDEDPKLPVSIEIEELRGVFGNLYHFSVEVWKIPSDGSHKKLNRKVLDFVELGGDSKEDLKIVYYGGHGPFTLGYQLYDCAKPDCSRPAPSDRSFQTVKWSGIQHALEEAESDVLLLLDCCASGTANTDSGRGVTELISACGFNTSANPVGPDSFTRALITELKLLKNAAPFTVGSLYNKLLRRLQSWMPTGKEMQKPPLHVVLTQNHRLPQSIQFAALKPPQSPSQPSLPRGFQNLMSIPEEGWSPPSQSISGNQTSSSSSTSPSITSDPLQLTHTSSHSSVPPSKNIVPRISISVRLKETLSASQLSTDLFADWLRMMPANVEQVTIEAGFASFSTLLIVLLPIEIWCYLTPDPAISLIGFVKSANLIMAPSTKEKSEHQLLVDDMSKEDVLSAWGLQTPAMSNNNNQSQNLGVSADPLERQSRIPSNNCHTCGKRYDGSGYYSDDDRQSLRSMQSVQCSTPLPPLAMSQTKDDLLKHLNMPLGIYTLMAKETDQVYNWLTSHKLHLKRDGKRRKPPYDWSDIVEVYKEEAIEKLANGGDTSTSYYWNLAEPTWKLSNWIARWFLYHKFRYRDGRNRNPVVSEGKRKWGGQRTLINADESMHHNVYKGIEEESSSAEDNSAVSLGSQQPQRLSIFDNFLANEARFGSDASPLPTTGE